MRHLCRIIKTTRVSQNNWRENRYEPKRGADKTKHKRASDKTLCEKRVQRRYDEGYMRGNTIEPRRIISSLRKHPANICRNYR